MLAGMEYLHTMIRVRDLGAALHFFVDVLGLKEIRRRDSEQGEGPNQKPLHGNTSNTLSTSSGLT